MKSLILILFFGLTNYLLSQEVMPGLTIFTPQNGGGGGGGGTTTYLKNENGTTIKTWNHSNGPASMPYMYPDSSILYPYRVNNPTMNSGGVGGGVQRISWNGEILWDFVMSNDTYQHHHDVEPLPNGNVLIVAWERFTASEAIALGREVINNPLNECWSEAILEYNPDLDEIVWEWHLWDHFIQDVNPSLPNYGNISDHPELWNINEGTIGGAGGPGGEPNADWIHINAIAYNSELDQIVFSSRHVNEIFVIDHSTTTDEAAGHTGGIYGKGGDFLYRWGNPQNYGRGNSGNQQLNSQHGVNWIKSGYPGENNFILYNNVYSGQNSAVFEISPPYDSNGNYIIEDGQPYGPSNVTWMHTGGFYSNVQSGAFRLQNGNTLITDADSKRIFEVTYNGSIVYDFIQNNAQMIPRAQKYSYDHFSSYEPGDVNADENIDVLDIVLVVNIILGLSSDVPASDYNQDGITNVLDIVAIVNIILGG
tara:strand:+ start:783 stop:2219 length:1437 start_codon:yes stop_codon:yes gene_type:complete